MKFLSLILASCLFFSSVQAQAKNFLFDATSFDPQPVMVAAANNLVPTGTVMVWTQEEIPEGWLECNGQSVNKTRYPDLYKIMTKTPDYRDRFLQGANRNLGQKIEAGLPNIKGSFNDEGIEKTVAAGAFSVTIFSGHRYAHAPYDHYDKHQLNFDASKSNPIYGKSNTVQPPAITVKYIIKAE